MGSTSESFIKVAFIILIHENFFRRMFESFVTKGVLIRTSGDVLSCIRCEDGLCQVILGLGICEDGWKQRSLPTQTFLNEAILLSDNRTAMDTLQLQIYGSIFGLTEYMNMNRPQETWFKDVTLQEVIQTTLAFIIFVLSVLLWVLRETLTSRAKRRSKKKKAKREKVHERTSCTNGVNDCVGDDTTWTSDDTENTINMGCAENTGYEEMIDVVLQEIGYELVEKVVKEMAEKEASQLYNPNIWGLDSCYYSES